MKIKTIEAFQKEAEKLGTDKNSIEELKMYLEAEQEEHVGGYRDNVEEGIEEAVGTIISDLSDSLHSAAEHIASEYGFQDSQDVYHRLVDTVREAEWE
jgi:hypothetical protein